MRSAPHPRAGWNTVMSGRPDAISRGVRPGPAAWFYTPTDYTSDFPGPEPWSDEESRPGAALGTPRHRRAYHAYLQGAEERAAEVTAGDRIRVGHLMTENPEAVTPETTIEAAAQRMAAREAGMLPVVESPARRRLVGVLTDRGIVVHAVANGRDSRTPIAECMSQDFEAVNKNDGIRRAREVMRRHRLQRLPVTDREGRLVGILTEADLGIEFGGAPGGEPSRPLRAREEPSRPTSSGRRGGFVIGPTDQGGDIGFRPRGVLGLDEW